MEFRNGDDLPFLSPLKHHVRSMNSRQVSQEDNPFSGVQNQISSSPYFPLHSARRILQVERETEQTRAEIGQHETAVKHLGSRLSDFEAQDEYFDLDSFIDDRVDIELDKLEKSGCLVVDTPRSFISIPAVTPGGSATGETLQLRSIHQVPKPFDQVFRSQFQFFNKVQSKVFLDIFHSDKHLVLSSPTATGKSTIFELALIRALLSFDSVSLYFAPMKSIVNERFRDWSERFCNIEGIQDECKLRPFEWTGDTITKDCEVTEFERSIQKMKMGFLNFTRLPNVMFNLILTTPEKWDATSRRWGKIGQEFTKKIRLVMIDEVHLLNDKTRGHTLEAVITRMKMTIAKVNPVRFVAVSATIPNAEDIATWFSNPKPRSSSVCHNFGPELRPVPLRKVVLGFPFDGKSHFKFEMNLNYRLPNVISTYCDSKPTLIFANSRKSAQMTASSLAQKLHQNLTFEHRQRLQEASRMISNESADHTKLKECLLLGVGFHHAGLTLRDRDVVEHLFRGGSLPILVSTTTLALGVNLPAHLVIVKSTCHMVDGINTEYEESQILQMLGRAGRPQFDTSATAVILTTEQQKMFYETLIDGSKPIESNLLNNLEEHLNAEIVLKTITDVAFALEWISSTFLFVRLLNDPQSYRQVTGNTRCPDALKKKLDDHCVRALNGMVTAGLLEMDPSMALRPTPAGGWMAKYYLAFDTVKEFLKYVSKDASDSDNQNNLSSTLNVICNSKELIDSLQLRRNEKRYLNGLNGSIGKKTKSADDTIRFPLGQRVKERVDKANIIIQSHFGCLDMHGESYLLAEGQRLIKVGRHLSQCLVHFVSGLSGNYNTLKNALILTKCFKSGLWENTSYVSKQIKGIGIAYSSALVHAGLNSFEKLAEKNPRELEMIVGLAPPQGNKIRDFSRLVPKYNVDVEIQGSCGVIRCSKTVYVRLRLTIVNSSEIQGASSFGRFHSSCLLVGNPVSGEIYLKQIVHDTNLLSSGFERQFPVMFFREPEKNSLEVSLISGSYAGVDIYKRFALGPIAGHSSSASFSRGSQTPKKVQIEEGNKIKTSEASFAIEDQLPKKMQASNLTFHVTEVMTSQSNVHSQWSENKKHAKKVVRSRTKELPSNTGLEPASLDALEWTSSSNNLSVEKHHFELVEEPESFAKINFGNSINIPGQFEGNGAQDLRIFDQDGFENEVKVQNSSLRMDTKAQNVRSNGAQDLRIFDQDGFENEVKVQNSSLRMDTKAQNVRSNCKGWSKFNGEVLPFTSTRKSLHSEVNLCKENVPPQSLIRPGSESNRFKSNNFYREFDDKVWQREPRPISHLSTNPSQIFRQINQSRLSAAPLDGKPLQNGGRGHSISPLEELTIRNNHADFEDCFSWSMCSPRTPVTNPIKKKNDPSKIYDKKVDPRALAFEKGKNSSPEAFLSWPFGHDEVSTKIPRATEQSLDSNLNKELHNWPSFSSLCFDQPNHNPLSWFHKKSQTRKEARPGSPIRTDTNTFHQSSTTIRFNDTWSTPVVKRQRTTEDLTKFTSDWQPSSRSWLEFLEKKS